MIQKLREIVKRKRHSLGWCACVAINCLQEWEMTVILRALLRQQKRIKNP
ncbi:MAG: hypothetical protein ACYS1A_19830 [Planctomycetota bacterium]